MSQIDHLLSAFAQAHLARPTDLTGSEVLPTPWETWALIGLVRHRQRQLWVGEIVTTRLGGSLLALADYGYGGHPTEVPYRGPVPGLPEWEYDFHGRGCCVTHRR